MEYCLCGHSHWEHALSNPEKVPYCTGCLLSNYNNCWHEFKLDNLRFIEDEAKERNLI